MGDGVGAVSAVVVAGLMGRHKVNGICIIANTQRDGENIK